LNQAEVEIVADMLPDVLTESEPDRVSVLAEVGSSLGAPSTNSEDESNAEDEDKEN
jgi:hypothetical protein